MTGHVIKYGKGRGRSAVDVLGYRRDGQLFVIDHIPTGTLFFEGYFYQSLTKIICETLIEHIGEGLTHNDPERVAAACPASLKDYCEYWEGRDIKQPPVYEEWLNGIEYQDLLSARRSRLLSEQQKAELANEILSSNSSLAWVSDPSGELEGSELVALITGKPH